MAWCGMRPSSTEEAPEVVRRAAWLLPICRRLEREIAAGGMEMLLHQVEILRTCGSPVS